MRIVLLVLVAILVGTTSQAIGENQIAGDWFDAESKSLYRFLPNGDFSFGGVLSSNRLSYGAYHLGTCGERKPGNVTLFWQDGEEVCYSAQFRGTRLHLVYREQRLHSESWGIPENCKLVFEGTLPILLSTCRNIMLVRY